jgi:hypothetical protein
LVWLRRHRLKGLFSIIGSPLTRTSWESRELKRDKIHLCLMAYVEELLMPS